MVNKIIDKLNKINYALFHDEQFDDMDYTLLPVISLLLIIAGIWLTGKI